MKKIFLLASLISGVALGSGYFGGGSAGGSASIGGSVTGGTDNAILFIDPTATLNQDPSFFSYDNSVHQLTLGVAPIISPFSTAGIVHNSALGLLSSSLIVNADISASAAIARSKVAVGTASEVIVNDGSGNLSSVGQIAISQGGTGQSTKGPAFNALSPLSAKGDIVTHTGANNVRQAVGADNLVLIADAAQTNGIKWSTVPMASVSGSTANYAAIFDGSGNLTSEQRLAKSRGGTGADNSSVTFPTTGIVVTEAASETLTNKTISGGSNTITNVSLTTGVTGTLPIGNGGTGQITNTLGFNALSPVTTKGDLIVRDSTNNVRLGVGTNKYVLQADSTQSTGMAWANLETLTSYSSAGTNNVASTDAIVYSNSSANAVTLSLPAASGLQGHTFKISNTGANNTTIDPNASELVCGKTTILLSGAQDAIEIVSTNSEWAAVSGGGCYRTTSLSVDPSAVCSTGTCSIAFSNGGSWATVTRSSAGVYSTNLTSGIFSSAPVCEATINRNQNARLVITSSSTSAVGVTTLDSTGTPADSTFTLVCHGPR